LSISMVFPRSVLVVGATSKTLLRLVKGRPERRCQASVTLEAHRSAAAIGQVGHDLGRR
jgi:hypothetical protein